jgi:hypothetical protein
MLSGAKFRQNFWTEAVGTTCYWVNQSPSLVLYDKYGVKVYNIWNPKTNKTVYSQDVFFREVKDPKMEFLPS